MFQVSDAIIVALIAAVGAPFVKGYFDERKAKKDREMENAKIVNALDDLSNSVLVLQASQDDNKEAHIAIIRDRLTQAYDFFTKKQSITLHQKNTISGLYDIYRAVVGDNTFVAELMVEINKIPIENTMKGGAR